VPVRESLAGPPPSSTLLERTIAVGAAAKTLSVLLVPGMRGIGSQTAVDILEWAGSALSYIFGILLCACLMRSSRVLLFTRLLNLPTRGVVLLSTLAAVTLAVPAALQRIDSAHALPLALARAVSVGVIAAGAIAFFRPPSRWPAAAVLSFALCNLVRIGSWRTAMRAAESHSAMLLQYSNVLSTLHISLLAFAIGLSIVWIWPRSSVHARKTFGIARAAILIPCAIGFAASDFAGRIGNTEIITPLRDVIRGSVTHAMATAAGAGQLAMLSCLLGASILLPLAALTVVEIPAHLCSMALGLALLSHGAFDVPIQALAGAAAAQWLLMAFVEEKAIGAAAAAATYRARQKERFAVGAPSDG